MANQFSRTQRASAAQSTLASIRQAKRKAQMTKTILLITFIYIIATLPGILQTGYFYTIVIVYDWGPMFVSLINAIHFTYPAFNFFTLYFTNKLFADEIRKRLVNLKRSSVTFFCSSSNPDGNKPRETIAMQNRNLNARKLVQIDQTIN